MYESGKVHHEDVIDQDVLQSPSRCKYDKHEELNRAFVKNHKLVYGICLRLLKDPGMAEDAVQSTFFRFMVDKTKIRKNVRAWLYCCARSVSLNMLSAEKARHRRERMWQLHRQIRSQHRYPSTVFSRNETREFPVESLLTNLSKNDRELLTAYYYCSRTQNELACEAGVTYQAIQKRLKKIIGKLRAYANERKET